MISSTNDRHEYYEYDTADRIIQLERDAVRMYNPKTGHYDLSIRPATKTVYNSFGEVILTQKRINESEWANTYFYYDNDGQHTATIDAEGYLTSYTYTALGDLATTKEYARASTEYDKEAYKRPSNDTADREVVFNYDALGHLTQKTLKQVRYACKNKENTFNFVTEDIITKYSYDALGQLTKTEDAQGNTVYCYYSALGQLITKVGPQVKEGRSAVTYAYDALGHLVETHQWASGATINDKEEVILGAATDKDNISHMDYDVLAKLRCKEML